MKLYVVIHLYDAGDGLVQAGVNLTPFTSRAEADLAMYESYDSVCSQLDPDEIETAYSETLGFAQVFGHKQWPNGSITRVLDHEWRIVTM